MAHQHLVAAGATEGSTKKKICLFNVVFDGENDYYLPGEDVTGTVFIHSIKPFKAKGIIVRLMGSCFVSDSKRHNHSSDEHYRAFYRELEYRDKKYDGKQVSNQTFNLQSMRKYYKNVELYFNIKQQLWGGFDSNEYFPVGEFSYPFNITLPLILPTSFEGSRGYIRYTATAKIQRQWSPSVNCTRTFLVCPRVELSSVANAMEPVIVHDTKQHGFMMFKTGPIHAKVTINRKGFIPGERIVFTAEISNDSPKDITSACVALLSVINYRLESSIKEERTILHQITHGTIRSKDSEIWKDCELLIPENIPPSGLNGCGLIILEYVVQFTVTTPLGSDMEIILPIVIGSEPLKDSSRADPEPAAAEASGLTPSRPPRPSHLAKQMELTANLQQYAPNGYLGFEGMAPMTDPSVHLENAVAELGSATASGPARPPPSYEESTSGDQGVASFATQHQVLYDGSSQIADRGQPEAEMNYTHMVDDIATLNNPTPPPENLLLDL